MRTGTAVSVALSGRLVNRATYAADRPRCRVRDAGPRCPRAPVVRGRCRLASPTSLPRRRVPPSPTAVRRSTGRRRAPRAGELPRSPVRADGTPRTSARGTEPCRAGRRRWRQQELLPRCGRVVSCGTAVPGGFPVLMRRQSTRRPPRRAPTEGGRRRVAQPGDRDRDRRARKLDGRACTSATGDPARARPARSL